MSTSIATYLRDHTGLNLNVNADEQSLTEIRAACNSREENQSKGAGNCRPSPKQALYDAVVGIDNISGAAFASPMQGTYESLGVHGLSNLIELTKNIRALDTVAVIPPSDRSKNGRFSSVCEPSTSRPSTDARNNDVEQYLDEIASAALRYVALLESTEARLQKNDPELENRHTLIKTDTGPMFEMTNSMTAKQRSRLIAKTSVQLPQARYTAPAGSDEQADVFSSIVLGKGGFGTVRVARDVSTDTYVAAKKIHAKIIVSNPPSCDPALKIFEIVPAVQPNFLKFDTSVQERLRETKDAIIAPNQTAYLQSRNAGKIAGIFNAISNLGPEALEDDNIDTSTIAEEPPENSSAEKSTEHLPNQQINKAEESGITGSRITASQCQIESFKQKKKAINADKDFKKLLVRPQLARAGDVQGLININNAFNNARLTKVKIPSSNIANTYYLFSELGITNLANVIDKLNVFRTYFEGKNDFERLSEPARNFLIAESSGSRAVAKQRYNASEFRLNDTLLNSKFINTMARKMIAALAALHDADFSHRDVKPANMVFCMDKGNYTVKLIDIDFVMSGADDREFPEAGDRRFLPQESFRTYKSLQGMYDGKKADAFGMGVSLRLAGGNHELEMRNIGDFQNRKIQLKDFKRNQPQNDIAREQLKLGKSTMKEMLESQKTENYHVQNQLRIFAVLNTRANAATVRDIADLMLKINPGKRKTPAQILDPESAMKNFFENPHNFLNEADFKSHANELLHDGARLTQATVQQINRQEHGMKDLQNVRRRATHAAKVARMVAAPSSVVGKNIYSSLSRREAFAVCFTHSVYQTINTLTVSFPRSVADLATCRKDTAERTLNYPNRRYDVPREK